MKTSLHRIAVVTPLFLPVEYGIEMYVAELCKRLKRKYDITIYTCSRQLDEYYGIRVKGYRSLDYHDIATALSIKHKVIYPVPVTMLRDLMRDKIDLINVHGHDFATSYIAALAAKRRKIPLILTNHSIGLAWLESRFVNVVRRILDPSMVTYIVRSADIVISVTKTAKDYISKYRPRQVEVVYQGVDTEAFRPSYRPSGPVAFVGRLIPTKAPEVFIRAIPLVLKEYRTNFLIIGGGPLRGELEALAVRLGIREHVNFLGEISHQKIPSILREVSVVAVPYLGGLVLLESMAMKKILVCARFPWTEEMVGDAAYYIKPKDPADLASAIIKVLRDPHLSKVLAEKGYERVLGRFSWESVAAHYGKIFDGLLEK